MGVSSSLPDLPDSTQPEGRWLPPSHWHWQAAPARWHFPAEFDVAGINLKPRKLASGARLGAHEAHPGPGHCSRGGGAGLMNLWPGRKYIFRVGSAVLSSFSRISHL